MCVLVVEDEPLIREIMVEILREAGLEVMEAAEGEAALALARDPPRRFTALVTDFHMVGKIDGYQIARRFRELSPDIPVIIMTGRPDVFQTEWQRDFGFKLLKKPFRPSDLLTTVQAMMKAIEDR